MKKIVKVTAKNKKEAKKIKTAVKKVKGEKKLAKANKKVIIGLGVLAALTVVGGIATYRIINNKMKENNKSKSKKPLVILIDGENKELKSDLVDKMLQRAYNRNERYSKVYTISDNNTVEHRMNTFLNINSYDDEKIMIIDNLVNNKIKDIDLLEMIYGYGKFNNLDVVIILNSGGIDSFINKHVKFTSDKNEEIEYITFELQYGIDGCVQCSSNGAINILANDKLTNVSMEETLNYISKLVTDRDKIVGGNEQ